MYHKKMFLSCTMNQLQNLKSLLLIITFLLISSLAFAQGWQTETNVDSSFIDQLNSTSSANNEYMSVGTTRKTNPGMNHPLLVKTSSNGDTLLTRIFSWIQGEAFHIINTMDGNFVSIGYQMLSPTNSQMLFFKVNSSGDTLWTRNIGGGSGEEGYKLAQNSAGEIYLAGITRSYGNGSADVYIVKINTNGDTLWTRTFGTSDFDQPTSIYATPQGGCIVSGYLYGSWPTQPFLIKYSSAGDTIWTKKYPGIFGNPFSFITDMCPTYDGGYIMACSTYVQSVGFKSGLIKVNSTADTLWTKIFNSSLNYYRFSSVAENLQNDLVLTGTSNYNGSSKILLFTLSSIGDSLSTAYYVGGGKSEGNEIRLLSDGGYIISGFSRYSTSTNATNCLLVRISGTISSIFSPFYAKDQILAFPNPSYDNTRFYLQEFRNVPLNFSLSDGNTVIAVNDIIPDALGNFMFKIDHLPQGIYFYSFSSNEKIISSGKLLIER